jgi:hypothetical protein
VGTEKSLAIPLISLRIRCLPAKLPKKYSDDFQIFFRRSKLDLEPILPNVRWTLAI